MEPVNEFYDSLEDEDCPDLLSQRLTPSASSDSLTIPFYGRETPKAALPKATRSKLPRLASSLVDAKTKRSYVDLFRAKVAHAPLPEATDTTRAACDDDSFKTARSDLSDDDGDTASFVSDSSFYAQFIESERRSRSSVASKASRAPSEASRTRASTTTTTTRARAKFDKAILKVPTLGGLGPDREASRAKLDTLKRKQKYGQRVSNQNRVRIMEMKVMKNFKYELKKSSELNKCAESVLNT